MPDLASVHLRSGPARALVAALAAALLLAGCSEKAINVSEAEIGPEQTSATLTDSADEERAMYFQDDESVRLAVRFDVNFVAVYKSYYAWWYFPDGRVYLRQPVRNQFGSHLSLITSMGIRDQPPASRPGRWKVALTLRNRLLVEREFEIREGTRAAAESAPEPVAAAAPAATDVATPPGPAPEPPLCPDPGSPPGWCNWEAPEEGGTGVVQASRLGGAQAAVAAAAQESSAAARDARAPPAEPAAPDSSGTADDERQPPTAAVDLSNAEWIPLPAEPSRFAPLCPDPGSSPGNCNWQAPDEGGIYVRSDPSRAVATTPSEETLPAAAADEPASGEAAGACAGPCPDRRPEE